MNNPARLDRINEPKSVRERIDEFALAYAHIILPLCLIILVILFLGLCYAICGVSATESGLKYNHFQNIIFIKYKMILWIHY